MHPTFDVVVAGGGIVGLATAMRLLERRPGLRLALLEKETALATQQTGHNSGVIHSGIYYVPGSVKARACVAGRRALVAFCESHGIPYRTCGKLIVALHEDELPRLQELYRRAQANEVEDVSLVGPERIREIEPHAVGLQAIHVGCTGIVDFGAVAAAYAEEVRRGGGEIRVAAAVKRVTRDGDGLVIETTYQTVRTRFLVACAGLYSDRLAGRAGAPDDLRIVPFRGDYYALKPDKTYMCNALIYPVPDPAFPFLGVHFTRRMDGSVWAGPNAVLAFARQGYGRWDFSARDLWDTVSYPGFWVLAARYWRMGMAEMWRDYVKSAYVAAMREYLPDLAADDVVPGPSGVRAQALARDGRLLDDFALYETDRAIHVRNAPSPAATSSLGIADVIVGRAVETFGI